MAPALTPSPARHLRSKLFAPARALGLVSNHIPLAVRYIKRRREHLIVTCVGRAFHTYGFNHLALLSTSPQHTGDICCLAVDTYHVYTAVGSQIFAWRRGLELVHTYGEAGGAEVRLMLPFGVHLVVVDGAGVLKVWDIKGEEVYTELTFEETSFEVSAITHPSTYINKVLLGSHQGSLQLWNLHKAKLIYTFHGWNSAVTVLEQTPAVDVVAVGLEDGRIILHNLKYDETVTTFVQDWGAVTSLAFCTDRSPTSRPMLVSASPSGHVVLWDLEARRTSSQLKAHSAGVGGVVCLTGEPVLITSSPDNSLKVWLLGEGQADEVPRLLRIREGHAAPPAFLRFHGPDAKNVVTAGADSTVRIFSTVTETFNKSLGKASYNRKVSKKRKASEDPLIMPPITQFASEPTRSKEWDDIVAVHLGLPLVTTWSYDKLRMGQHKLCPDRFDAHHSKLYLNAYATCVCLTRCGNFTVVGYSSGHVDRFNVQSGVHRDQYGDPAHGGAVRGVYCEVLNRLVVTVGADAKMRFWPFKCRGSAHMTEVDLGEPALFLRSHGEASLVAVALEDFTVSVVDVDGRTVVRRFLGHCGVPTDAAFSPDARWLVTAAMDCQIRTWDLPNGSLVDCFQTEEPCTSLTFSPTGDLLATAHVDCLGVFLWCNRALFSHVSLRPLDPTQFSETLCTVPLPATRPDQELEGQGDGDSGDPEDGDEADVRPDSPVQMPGDLITLSGLANSRWQNVLSLDVIRQRNKPRAPPRPQNAAPFFLPTVPSVGDVRFDLGAQEEETTDEPKTWRMPVNLTVFGKMLTDSAEGDEEKLVAKLKDMGPSALDLEVTSLAPEAGGSVELLARFLRLLDHMTASGRDFELAQAHLALFLKRHGDLAASEAALEAPLADLVQLQGHLWGRLQKRLMHTTAVVGFLRNA